MLRQTDKQKSKNESSQNLNIIPQDLFNLKDFNEYKHTVWNHHVLDINGLYLLQSVDDKSAGYGEDTSVTFYFKHSQTEDLSCSFSWILQGSEESRFRIKIKQ